jgi:hypothetical protein
MLLVTFTLHLVPMSLLVGGSACGVAAAVLGRRDPRAAALAAWVARALPIVVAATITPGVAALLFLQVLYGRAFFSATILVAVPWLAVVPILILAYYGTYLASSEAWLRGAATRRTILSGLVALLVATIAFVYSNAMSLAARPQSFAARFAADAGGFHLNLGDPTLAPRFLHIFLGALAVGGAGIAVGALALRRRDPDLSAWAIRFGAICCAGATALNILPGFWWLAALPSPTPLRFMGRDAPATAVFAIGVLAGLSALGHLIPAAFAPRPRPLLVGGGASLLVCLASMAVVRDVARRAALDGAGWRAVGWVEPQWGAVSVFAVLAGVAAATMVWMFRRLAQAPPQAPSRAASPVR